MSPAGGVGINLAVQDAVAAATLLAQPLRRQQVTTEDLAAVQRRRNWPAQVVQTGQVLGHRLVLDRVLDRKNLNLRGGKTLLSIVARFPQLSMIPAYSMGIGVRPEHAPEFARRTPQPAD